MCICVDCTWVDRCKTYFTVEENHGVKHLSENPDFQGINPKIHINISDMPEGETDQGKWSRLRPGEEIPN